MTLCARSAGVSSFLGLIRAKMGAYLVPPNMNLWQHLTHILACLVAITPVSHPTDEFDITAGCYRIPVKRTGDKVLWDFCQIGMVSEHRNLEILW